MLGGVEMTGPARPTAGQQGSKLCCPGWETLLPVRTLGSVGIKPLLPEQLLGGVGIKPLYLSSCWAV